MLFQLCQDSRVARRGNSYPFSALWENLSERDGIFTEIVHLQIILGRSFLNMILLYCLLLCKKHFTNLWLKYLFKFRRTILLIHNIALCLIILCHANYFLLSFMFVTCGLLFFFFCKIRHFFSVRM